MAVRSTELTFSQDFPEFGNRNRMKQIMLFLNNLFGLDSLLLLWRRLVADNVKIPGVCLESLHTYLLASPSISSQAWVNLTNKVVKGMIVGKGGFIQLQLRHFIRNHRVRIWWFLSNAPMQESLSLLWCLNQVSHPRRPSRKELFECWQEQCHQVGAIYHQLACGVSQRQDTFVLREIYKTRKSYFVLEFNLQNYYHGLLLFITHV